MVKLVIGKTYLFRASYVVLLERKKDMGRDIVCVRHADGTVSNHMTRHFRDEASRA